MTTKLPSQAGKSAEEFLDQHHHLIPRQAPYELKIWSLIQR